MKLLHRRSAIKLPISSPIKCKWETFYVEYGSFNNKFGIVNVDGGISNDDYGKINVDGGISNDNYGKCNDVYVRIINDCGQLLLIVRNSSIIVCNF
jgi:hypothetical protein